MGSLSLLWPIVTAFVIYFLTVNTLSLRKNIREAKRSQLPYVVLPIHAHNPFASLVIPTAVRFINRIFGPPSSGASWRWLIQLSWSWEARHAPFAALGTDTFIAAAPGGCIVYTADADVIHQLTTRKQDFPKPVERYKIIDIFGTNVVSTEGADWKRHRRLVAPAFGESINRAVWEESLWRTRLLLQEWTRTTEDHDVVRSTQADSMKLTLEVLGKVAFSLDMSASSESEADSSWTDESAIFARSLHYLMSNLLPIIMLPHWFIKCAPFASLRKAYQSFVDVRKFTRKILAEKRAELHAQDHVSISSNDDLIGRLVRASTEQDSSGEKSPDFGSVPSGVDGLSDSEVLGNAFVFLFAGHDTTAGTIHSILTFMALHPGCQRKLQLALDAILEQASPEDYSTIVPKLLNEPYLNAVVNETFRLTCPAPVIPKCVLPSAGPQPLIVNGREALIPVGSLLKIQAASVHRNPKYWAHRVEDAAASHWTSWPPSNPSNDLEAFRPERWIQSTSSGEGPMQTLVTPPPGAYVPFSDGARACLGKRFAIMEIFAVLTVLFSACSVELAVGDFFTPEEVRDASKDRKTQMWEAAAEKANDTWRKHMSSLVTLQLRNAHIPLRFVKRGEEMFI